MDNIANMVKCASDESFIVQTIEKILSDEATYSKNVSKLKKAMEDKERERKAEIEELKRSFQIQNDKLEEMIKQNKRLIARVEELETEKEVNSKLNKLILNIISYKNLN